MKRIFIVLLLIAVIPSNAHAVWLGATGKVKTIMIYGTTDTVLVELDSPGVPVAECSNNTVFVINGADPADRRKQMLSALLATKATGEILTLKYLDVGGCVAWGSDPNAYRGLIRIDL